MDTRIRGPEYEIPGKMVIELRGSHLLGIMIISTIIIVMMYRVTFCLFTFCRSAGNSPASTHVHMCG